MDDPDYISTTTDWDYSDLAQYPEDQEVFPPSLASLTESFKSGSIDTYSAPLAQQLHYRFASSLPNLSQNNFDNYAETLFLEEDLFF